VTDTDKKRYLLQEAHHERIFQRRIVPRALAGGRRTTPTSTPGGGWTRRSRT